MKVFDDLSTVFRHLESELGRLKYKDPLRSCEIPMEDFTFNENGKNHNVLCGGTVIKFMLPLIIS